MFALLSLRRQDITYLSKFSHKTFFLTHPKYKTECDAIISNIQNMTDSFGNSAKAQITIATSICG